MLTFFSRWKTKGTMEKILKDTNQKYFVGNLKLKRKFCCLIEENDNGNIFCQVQGLVTESST